MNSRSILLIVVLGILTGLVFGVIGGSLYAKPKVTLASDAVELDRPEQDDFIIMVAEAFSGDHSLKLAQDRLTRLNDSKIEVRVENLALSYAPQNDLIAARLAILAVAMGSKNPTLVRLSATATPTSTFTPTPTATATNTPTPTATFTPTNTPTPLPTSTSTPTSTFTPTPLPTRRPPTVTPSPTPTYTPAPPPPIAYEPWDLSRWPGTVHFTPADVAPGQTYWHLVKATYCDAYGDKDQRGHQFGCDEMPGGPAGTSIYVMSKGAKIKVIRPDGTDVAQNRAIVGDKKSPNDMCNCTYAFEASNYRISVAEGPSDAIEGFCLCSVNFGWGSRAHVRYFLYFEQVVR